MFYNILITVTPVTPPFSCIQTQHEWEDLGKGGPTCF